MAVHEGASPTMERRQRIIPTDDVENPLNEIEGIIHLDMLLKFPDPETTVPTLNDPILFKEYRANQKKQIDIVSVLPLLMIVYVICITRSSWFDVSVSQQPLFICAFVLVFLTNIIALLYFGSQLVTHITPKQNQFSSIYRLAELFIHRSFGGRIEDVICILAMLTSGMYLLARVMAGQCDAASDIWTTQTCNPVANCKSIPHDQVIVVYTMTIICQIILRGVSAFALILSWLGVVIYVTIAVIHVGGWSQLWTILYSTIFMSISFEIERSVRVAFLRNRELQVAERLKSKQEAEFSLLTLKNNHEIELLQVSTENEKILREGESFQLRSLMGNVAHDLKTPLHSIEADLEVLHTFILKIPQHEFLDLLAKFGSNEDGHPLNLFAVFESLNATCKFMAMAINRSQDFMKASNNIALTPALETFGLKDALEMSVNCIVHHQSSRTIVVHPFGKNILPRIISDKHWFVENLLCLLSNAVKYSEGGFVDVKVQLSNRKLPRYLSSIEERSKVRDCDENRRASTGEQANDTPPLSRAETMKMILVTVEDTGIGISEDARKNLFQPFKQAQRMVGGTGLGLYSLSKRIEALGGRCGCSDRRDAKQGSMFWFSFPYRPDNTADAIHIAETSAQNDLTPAELSGVTGIDSDRKCDVVREKSLRILLIDDSLTILKVTSRLLQINGHTVETASNGFLGLKRLEKAFESNEFDMVLSDLQMPIMDGLEATKRYRKFEEEKSEKLEEFEKFDEHRGESEAKSVQVKGKSNSEMTTNYLKKKVRLLIVGMSANSDQEIAAEALISGMDYFITKPFSYKELSSVIRNHGNEFH